MMNIDDRIEQITKELAQLDTQKESLLQELAIINQEKTIQPKTLNISNEQISIFHNLFFGRQDVYAKRFENHQTKQSGYLPCCINEWKDGLCKKPFIKCSKCTNKKYAPFSDEIIKHHLQGFDNKGKDFTAGIYPLQIDETCRFLAIDFDGKNFKEDAKAVYQTCKKHNIPAYMEISRSGNGIHIWIFFSTAVYGTTARKLGSYILTETLKNYAHLTFESYDRLFPNQDTLPAGGLGNLIALPFQAKPRLSGHSIFVNEEFIPFSDQWNFLYSIRKMPTNEILNIVTEASKLYLLLPVPENNNQPAQTLSTIHQNCPVDIKLDDSIYLYRKQLSPQLRAAILSTAAFTNPEFYAFQAMRMSTYHKPRIIRCFEESENIIKLPRGCIEKLIEILQSNNIIYHITDTRNSGNPINISFTKQLYPEQTTAINTLLNYDNGILVAPTAFGKTIVAINLMVQRNTNTLILVHRTHLIEQWKHKILSFTNILPHQIGEIHGSKKNITNIIDIASIQSLIHKHTINSIIKNYGLIITDECHHLSAFSFESVIKEGHPKYVLGLSATLIRKDGHQPIVTMQCGPVRYQAQEQRMAQYKTIKRTVIVRQTTTVLPDFYSSNTSINNIYDILASDKHRNEQIISDVKEALANNRSPVIVTERKKHLDYLAAQFANFPNVFVMKGGMQLKTRQKIYNDFLSVPEKQNRLLITTGKFLGEGFDDPRLDTLFLVMPISWQGTLAQYVGRLNRIHENKNKILVYDYIDIHINITIKMFQKRLSGYKNLHYEIADSNQMSLDL